MSQAPLRLYQDTVCKERRVGQSLYANQMLKSCYLLIENHDPQRNESVLCKKFLNFDIIICFICEQDASFTCFDYITKDYLKLTNLDEDIVWEAAYLNTLKHINIIPSISLDFNSDNKVFRTDWGQFDKDGSWIITELGEHYSGILCNEILFDFCNEHEIDHCFIYPSRTSFMFISLPGYSENGKPLSHNEHVEKLFEELYNIELEENVDSDQEILDPVIYVYHKDSNEVSIFHRLTSYDAI